MNLESSLSAKASKSISPNFQTAIGQWISSSSPESSCRSLSHGFEVI